MTYQNLSEADLREYVKRNPDDDEAFQYYLAIIRAKPDRVLVSTDEQLDIELQKRTNLADEYKNIPIACLIPILVAISDRSWEQFKILEASFVAQYSINVWQDVFNFRIKPALDKDADRWLLVQKCSTGIKSIKVVDEY